MINKEFLKYCRYHKGEEECPYAMNTPQYTFWCLENGWLKDVIGNDQYMENYGFAFAMDFPYGLEEFDDIPEYLKATMHNYYTHFNGGYSDGFIDFLRAYKKNAPK